MSFAKMSKADLEQVAETFGVEIDGRWGEQRIVAEILNDGITWDMWEEANQLVDPELIEQNVPEPEDEPEPEQKPDTTKRFKSKNAVELLKMERWNPTFQILGYKFTREHPFVLVKPDEANWIMAHEHGFRIATPEEAEAFYK